jgi:glutathione S-transferase
MNYPELRLISHKLCPYVQRARIVLAEKQVPHTIEFIDLANKPGWFLEISPLGKVPVLLVDGQPLFESSVIAEYLDEISPGSLHPDEAFDKARNRSFMEFASATLASIATFYRAPDADALDAATATLRGRFETLEAGLRNQPYFNGDRFSIVDAAFGPVFRYFEVIDNFGDFGFFDGLPRVNRWRRELAGRASVRNAIVRDYHVRLERFLLGLDAELARRGRAQQLMAANDG